MVCDRRLVADTWLRRRTRQRTPVGRTNCCVC